MRDPYEILGISRTASEAELRAAYHKLVQRHHPDHNHGSPESARKFEEVQEAYARVREMRAASAIRAAGMSAAGEGSGSTGADQGSGESVEERLADLERQVREAQAARAEAQAARAEAEAAAADARRRARAATSDARGRAGRPSDEELGYVTTDDSFSKILDDAASKLGTWLSEAESEVSDRVTGAQRRSAGKRVADLIEELERRLKREPPS